MDVTQTSAQPSWWSQSSASGEQDPKEDVRAPANENQQLASADDGWGGDGFGFDDFIDIINPLQHLPFVSTLYRELTGDQIAPAARMTGGTLYGGPAGLIASAANVMFEAENGGSDIGATAIAALEGSPAQPTNPAASASAPTILAEAPADETLQPAPGAIGTPQPTLLPPEAVAAYARASVLTNPTSGTKSVDWASGVVTPKSESMPGIPGAGIPGAAALPGMQSVNGGGLDALIRQSQAKVATRKRGPTLPSLVQPSPMNKGTTAGNTGGTTQTSAVSNSGLADWMMKALDKYDTMKVETDTTS